MSAFLASFAHASDRADDVSHTYQAAAVSKDILATRDTGIPDELLKADSWLAVTLEDKRFALAGGSYGRDLASYRSDHGWSAPVFIGPDNSKLSAEILTYTRSKAAFAGVLPDGDVVQAHKSGDEAMYCDVVDRHDLLDGTIPLPASTRSCIHELEEYGPGNHPA